ncbi:tonB-dependent receptor SusC [Flavobacteriaceae bacterium UJ101]|nr:tonB-dependent receptor SusC [Flavobacteriaceae bacterium UJ101]
MLICSNFIWSQQVIKGIITDGEGERLPEVSVMIKGTENEVYSDLDGSYEITAEKGDILIFSFLGMDDQEVIVSDSPDIDMVLTEGGTEIDEVTVVAVGFGNQELKKVSAAMSQVGEDIIQQIKPVRVEEALQGSASGVTVMGTGVPGEKPKVLIRGIPTNGNSDPLVIIDGVQLTLADFNALNPDDVKSINVIKDASAAIYGVKGANGVILVELKKGRKNMRPKISYTGYYGIQEVPRTIDVLNAQEYAAIRNEAAIASGEDLVFNNIASLGEGTDWQDEIFKTAPIMTHTLSLRGGGENTTYLFSTGYLSQGGIVGGEKNNFFDRLTVTSNVSTNFLERFNLSINTNYTNIKNKSVQESGYGGIIGNALNMDPTTPAYNADGSFGTSDYITQEIKNPLAMLANNFNENETNKISGKIELGADLAKGLKATSRFGYAYSNVDYKGFNPFVYYGDEHNQTSRGVDTNGIEQSVLIYNSATGKYEMNGEVTPSGSNTVTENKTTYYTSTWDNFINYDISLNDKHNFQSVVGISLQKNKGDQLSATRQGVPYNSWEFADISSATGTIEGGRDNASWQYDETNLSYFARLNYDYEGKYLLSGIYRRDGSTKFGDNYKFGNFWSISGGWVITKEDFFNLNAVNYLKLRGSYGITGNDQIRNYQYVERINGFPNYTFDDSITNGSTALNYANPDVHWEEQGQWNIGFDSEFWNNMVSLSFDYYQKETKDLLFQPELSGYFGIAEAPYSNIGTVENSGIDLTLNFKHELTNNFKINTGVTVTTIKNEVTEVNAEQNYQEGGAVGIPEVNLTRFQEGYAAGYFYGYKTDGIFQSQAEIDEHAIQTGAAPGDFRYVDINGDGIINDSDKTEIGNPFPDVIIGWNLGANYKGFDFALNTVSFIGNDVYRAYERNSVPTNRYASVLDRWTGTGTSNTTPRVTNVDSNRNTRISDYYVEDGSFLKIKNISLGYTIPKESMSKVGLESVRVYAAVKNAFTFTNYSGYDPEISAQSDDSFSSNILETGIDRGRYPQPRIWSMGININF